MGEAIELRSTSKGRVWPQESYAVAHQFTPGQEVEVSDGAERATYIVSDVVVTDASTGEHMHVLTLAPATEQRPDDAEGR